MGVETVAAAALVGSMIGTGAQAYTSYKAGKAQQKEIAKANELARAEANERKREAEELKIERRRERVQLVDDMRTQLGAGLGLDIVGTKYKKSPSVAPAGGTLG